MHDVLIKLLLHGYRLLFNSDVVLNWQWANELSHMGNECILSFYICGRLSWMNCNFYLKLLKLPLILWAFLFLPAQYRVCSFERTSR